MEIWGESRTLNLLIKLICGDIQQTVHQKEKIENFVWHKEYFNLNKKVEKSCDYYNIDISDNWYMIYYQCMSGPDSSPHTKYQSTTNHGDHVRGDQTISLFLLPSWGEQNQHVFIKMLLLVLPDTSTVDYYSCQIYEQ